MIYIKIWVDKNIPAPQGFERVKNIEDAMAAIVETKERTLNSMYDMTFSIEQISINKDIDNLDELIFWLKALRLECGTEFLSCITVHNCDLEYEEIITNEC